MPAASKSILTPVSIFKGELMPFEAMGFLRVSSCKSFTSNKIFSLINWLKMIRITTTPDSAKMVYLHSFWNRTLNQFISKAMGVVSFGANFKLSIVSILSSPSTCSPQPTSFSFLNFSPKQFFSSRFKSFRMQLSPFFPRPLRISTMASNAYAMARSIRKFLNIIATQFMPIFAMGFSLVPFTKNTHEAVYSFIIALKQVNSVGSAITWGSSGIDFSRFLSKEYVYGL